jgi:hypothetical protein
MDDMAPTVATTEQNIMCIFFVHIGRVDPVNAFTLKRRASLLSHTSCLIHHNFI